MGQIISVYGDLLLTAMGQTLLLALCGLFFACILGLIFGMMSVFCLLYTSGAADD